MNISINYSIGEILAMRDHSGNTPEIDFLLDEIESYKNITENRIKECVRAAEGADSDNKLRWVSENAPSDIKRYVCLKLLGKDYDVLRRSEKKYKTISEIGIEILSDNDEKSTAEEWLSEWEKQAKQLQGAFAFQLNNAIYETHAHYNLNNYNGFRERLMELMHKSGISDIVIPAVEYDTIAQMKQLFDNPKYDYVKYAFGSHPKYLWKEDWDEERWIEFRNQLKDRKCIAVGEAGLDYSYKGFCEEHRIKQQNCFERFIECANEAGLPLVLHIRPAVKAASTVSGDICSAGYKADYATELDVDLNSVFDSDFDADLDAEIVAGRDLAFDGDFDANLDADLNSAFDSDFDADLDALTVLGKNRPIYGAVLHCFGGNAADVDNYMKVGVTHFGIGGRICYDNKELEDAVRRMPEEAILIETDAPYIKLCKERIPNTSLSLFEIARKISLIRNTTVEHIIEITYNNAISLF